MIQSSKTISAETAHKGGSHAANYKITKERQHNIKKKTFILLLALTLITALFPTALADYTGVYSTDITTSFCRGESDRYSYWTRSDEQASLLAILLTQDLMREDYLAYNTLQPVDSLACIIYAAGENRISNCITLLYFADGACMKIYYYPTNDQASYSTENYTDLSDIVQYARTLAAADNEKVRFTFDPSSDFGDSTAAFGKAYGIWQSYYEQHPELRLSDDYLGW